MRLISIAALFVGLVLATMSPSFAVDRALVVGVGDYPGLLGQDGIYGHNDLVGPQHDVQNMHDLLVGDLGYDDANVKTMLNPDRQAIIDAITSWLIDGTAPGDRVLFYFSGHGTAFDIPDGKGGTRQTSGIIPHDAQQVEDNGDYVIKNLILGSQLRELVDKMTGRHVTLIADSCFSGSISRGIDTAQPGRVLRTLASGGKRVVLSPDELTPELVAAPAQALNYLDFSHRDAAGEDVAAWSAANIRQYSYDGGETGGVFTSAFIAGLKDRRADVAHTGSVTASNLWSYLQDQARAFCAPDDCGGVGLTPGLDAPPSYLASVMVPYSAQTLPPAPTQLPATPDGPSVAALASSLWNHTNDFALDAAILPDTTLKLNSTVRFRINSAEAGNLLVFDTGPDGAFRRIFPNPYSKAAGKTGTIRANAPLTIPDASYPFEFTADTAGDGALLVLVGEPGMDFSPIVSGAKAFDADPAPAKPVVALADILETPVVDPSGQQPTRDRRWAFKRIDYTVVP